MKRFYPIIIGFLLLGFFLSAFNASAQIWQTTEPIWLSLSDSEKEGANPKAEVNQISENSLDVTITFAGFWAEGQTRNGDIYTRVWHDDFGSYRDPGKPALPGKAFNVLVPNGVQIEVVNETFSSKTIALSQYSLPKKILPAQIQAAKSEPAPPWTAPDPKQYGSHDPFPQTWYEMKDSFRMRDYTIQPIWVNPVRYKAADGEVELLEKIELRLTWQDSNLDGVMSTVVSDSPSFDRLVSQIVINPPEEALYDTKSETGEGYLIITPDIFYDELQPFITMKDNQGYEVQVTLLSEIEGFDGPADGENDDIAAIQNFIRTLETPPTYLLLVGDTNWIPAPTGSVTNLKTDLYYATLDNEDYIPDIYVGRIPAQNESDILNVVEKMVSYSSESYQNWHTSISFIATCDFTYYPIAEGSHNYVINNYTSPLNFTGDFPEDELPSGGDQLYCRTNNALEADIITRLNLGRGIITYSGHGMTSAWYDGAFTIYDYDISNLNENYAYSFVSSFACSTNNFGSTSDPVGFGETWMTVPKKGAVAYLGSAGLTQWSQDDVLETSFYDSIFDNAYISTPLRIAINFGLNEVQREYPGIDLYQAKYYWESYNLLGDPSQQLWLHPEYKFEATTPLLERDGLINSTVRYPIEITNQSNTDSYSALIEGNDWDTNVEDLTNLPYESSGTLWINVKIPFDALPGDKDEIIATIYSKSDPDLIKQFTLSTTAIKTFFTHLPLINK